MIASMTGFVRVQGQGDWGLCSIEIKSVNHRYHEINMRLPEAFREQEMAWRVLVKAACTRGKVEVTVSYQQGEAQQLNVQLNKPLVKALVAANTDIAEDSGRHEPLRNGEIMRWPGVLSFQHGDMDIAKNAVHALLQSGLEQLQAVRQKEGNALAQLLLERIDSIEMHCQSIKPLLAQSVHLQREKLLTKINELKVDVDPQRLEQEVAILAQKADVTEEMDRLQTHLQEVRNIIEKGGLMGRRLDFFMQELNREANTLASKATDLALTQAAVDIKVLIEQIREQVQNIE